MLKSTSSLLLKIKNLLRQHISDPNFDISEFCKHLGISRTHLHRQITALTGLSTSHYLRQLRLEEAKELLETEDLLVYEVANKVGFSDVSYFSTSFSNHFGFPPKVLKNTNQNLFC